MVIPLIATVNPPVITRLRESVAASGVNALVSGFLNSNAMIAEALHIRLAEAGLARADRVRLFSIVTAADGVLIATVGRPRRRRLGQRDLGAARRPARAAGHHRVARQRADPSIDGVMRLKEMGVNRLAIAPCFIGPEVDQVRPGCLLAIGAECAAPIGAHSQHRQARRHDLRAGASAQLELPGRAVGTGTDSTSNRCVRSYARINQAIFRHILATVAALLAS